MEEISRQDSVLYFCTNPENWGIDVSHYSENFNHLQVKIRGYSCVWPRELTREVLSPESIENLTKEFEGKDWIIIDRLKNDQPSTGISDHVNRSEINYLRARTPYKSFPQFPDMSNVYVPFPGFKKAVVHTVGEEQFKEGLKEENVIFSESVGFISPLFHYIGVPVYAFGGKTAYSWLLSKKITGEDVNKPQPVNII